MAQLKEWLKQNWVRIGTDGSIKGPCGTSKDKKNPDRCLPKRKAIAMEQRAKVMKKTGPARVYRTYINSIKKS